MRVRCVPRTSDRRGNGWTGLAPVAAQEEWAGTPIDRRCLESAACTSLAITRFLLERGKDIGKDDLGAMLAAAANNNSNDVALDLLRRGAPVNGRNRRGRAPLHGASFYGNRALVKALLDAGADGSAKDRQGNTPMSQAKGNDAKEIVAILQAHGVPESGPNRR